MTYGIYDKNGEFFYIYDTKREAIKDRKSLIEDGEDVGPIVNVRNDHWSDFIISDNITHLILEDVEYSVDEGRSDYNIFDDLSDGDIDDLEQELQKMIVKWMKKTKVGHNLVKIVE